jgi:hypothetical protein
LGIFQIGATHSVSATLPEEGAETWYEVTFAGSSLSSSYLPQIQIESPSSPEFVFDVLNPGCGGSALACPGASLGECIPLTGTTTVASGLLSWGVFGGIGGGGEPGSNGTVYIRVYRAPNLPADCGPFTMNIGNGF